MGQLRLHDADDGKPNLARLHMHANAWKERATKPNHHLGACTENLKEKREANLRQPTTALNV